MCTFWFDNNLQQWPEVSIVEQASISLKDHAITDITKGPQAIMLQWAAGQNYIFTIPISGSETLNDINIPWSNKISPEERHSPPFLNLNFPSSKVPSLVDIWLCVSRRYLFLSMYYNISISSPLFAMILWILHYTNLVKIGPVLFKKIFKSNRSISTIWFV